MTEIPPELRRVKQDVERQLLNQPGVVGIDIGYKEVGGTPTEELAIRVLVEHKREVPGSQAIPRNIEGHATDVIERRYEPHVLTASVSQVMASVDKETYDPLQGGVSIGPCRPIAGVAYSGTLGAVVTDNKTGEPMLLGNHHVMAINDQWAVGDAMSQPSRPDSGVCPDSVAGTLERAVLTDKVDGAVAKATRKTLHEVAGIGPLTGTGPASIGQIVRKRGRTSGLTYGTIDTVDLTLQIDYGAGPHLFTDQIGIMPDVERNPKMGTHGDSGAVIVTEDGAVVGLYLGGDEQSGHGVANPIDAVLSALDVSFSSEPPGPESNGPSPREPPEEPPDKPTEPPPTPSQPIGRETEPPPWPVWPSWLTPRATPCRPPWEHFPLALPSPFPPPQAPWPPVWVGWEAPLQPWSYTPWLPPVHFGC